ncbi:MAG: GTPase [Planctomycetota bacterium]
MGASERETGCRAALLTPLGEGGISVIALDGHGAEAIADRCFRGRYGLPESEGLAHGTWRTEEGTVDEILVYRARPGRLEIHGHGGIGAARAILESLRREGVVIVSAGLLEEAGVDALSRAAKLALETAVSEPVAMRLLDQVSGASSRELLEVEALLVSGSIEVAKQRLETLLDHSRHGIAAHQGARVALIGRPNVGKSSLLNRLVQRERALVSETPGTTRDPVRADAVFDGWPVHLIDTAGVRAGAVPLEAAGIAMSWELAGGSDLTLVLFDATEAPSAEDLQLLEETAEWRRLLVCNKCDRRVDPTWERFAPGALRVSAHSGAGLEVLRGRIVGELGLDADLPAGCALLLTAEQADEIRAALEDLTVETRRAKERLTQLRLGHRGR